MHFWWWIIVVTVNYSKKPGFFKEQNAGLSAQIHSVTLTKTCFFKKGMLSGEQSKKNTFLALAHKMYIYMNLFLDISIYIQGNSWKGFGRLSCLLLYIHYISTPLHTETTYPKPFSWIPLYIVYIYVYVIYIDIIISGWYINIVILITIY